MEESSEKPAKSQAETTAEYWQSLEKWADSMRSMGMAYSFMSGLPLPMMMGPVSMTPPLAGPLGPPPAFAMPPPPPMMFAYNYPPQMPTIQPIPTAVPPMQYVEYRIPPLWKRFVAELIDFGILFLAKCIITFCAVDFFGFLDVDMIDITGDLDYKQVLEMTQEILIFELVHRIVVCFYEAVTLAQPSGGQPGGATPGKSIMGLRVVSCTQILQGAAPDIVQVYPAATLSIGFSFARAIIKLIVLFCLLPVCIPIFFYRFNRAGHDLICRCIVVEDRVRAR